MSTHLKLPAFVSLETNLPQTFSVIGGRTGPIGIGPVNPALSSRECILLGFEVVWENGCQYKVACRNTPGVREVCIDRL